MKRHYAFKYFEYLSFSVCWMRGMFAKNEGFFSIFCISLLIEIRKSYPSRESYVVDESEDIRWTKISEREYRHDEDPGGGRHLVHLDHGEDLRHLALYRPRDGTRSAKGFKMIFSNVFWATGPARRLPFLIKFVAKLMMSTNQQSSLCLRQSTAEGSSQTFFPNLSLNEEHKQTVITNSLLSSADWGQILPVTCSGVPLDRTKTKICFGSSSWLHQE